MDEKLEFVTTRKLVKQLPPGFLSEWTIRLLIKQGKVPGIYSGNRFLINKYQILKQLGCAE